MFFVDIITMEETILELQSNHTAEIESLEELILEKDELINETDSKMSMISGYVDQLEERLATFAHARQDMNAREKVCHDIEEREKQLSKDYAVMEKEFKEATSTRDELKGLVELMTEERKKLMEEKVSLASEKAHLAVEEKRLHDELATLQERVMNLEKEVDDTNMALENALSKIAEKQITLNQLQDLNEVSRAKLEKQERSLQETIDYSESLKEKLSQLEAENQRISALVVTLEGKINHVIVESEETSGNEDSDDDGDNQTIVSEDDKVEETTFDHEENVEIYVHEVDPMSSDNFIPPPPPPESYDEADYFPPPPPPPPMSGTQVGQLNDEHEAEFNDNDYVHIHGGIDEQNELESEMEADSRSEVEFDIVTDHTTMSPPDYFGGHYDDDNDEEENLDSYDDVEPRNESDQIIDDTLIQEDIDADGDDDSLKQPETYFDDIDNEPVLPSNDDSSDEGIDEISENHESKAPSSMPTEDMDMSHKERQIPLRSIRKTFSRITGVHGLFTPPSSKS